MPTMDNFTSCPALMLQNLVTRLTSVYEVDTNLMPKSESRVRKYLITILQNLGIGKGHYAILDLLHFSQLALPK